MSFIFKSFRKKTLLSCGRIKSEEFVTNVLGKQALEAVINNLKQHERPFFFGLQIDASSLKICSTF